MRRGGVRAPLARLLRAAVTTTLLRVFLVEVERIALASASLEGLRIRYSTTCDGSELSMRCPLNTVIDVTSAFYGRNQPSSIVCPYLHTLESAPAGFRENIQCESAESNLVTKQFCQERRSCMIPVMARIFGADPCPITGKYLSVGYRCMPVKFLQSRSCEGNTVNLQCDRSKRLFVNDAFYGWSTSLPNECQPSLTDNPAEVAGCSSSTASLQVKKRCSGRRTCLFEAIDTVLGRVCPQKNKFLDLSYVCVPKSILVSSWRGPNSTAVTSALSEAYFYTSQNDHPGDITAASSGSTGFEISGLPKSAGLLEQQNQPGLPGGRRVMHTSASAGAELVTEAGPGAPAASNTLCNETGLHANHRHGSAYGEDDLLMGWVHTLKYIQDNTEKMALYGALCGCLALLLATLLAVGRLLHMRRRRRGDSRHRHLLARGMHRCQAGDEDDEDSDRRKLNVSSDAGPPSADHSNEENTYVPAADPSDVAGLTAFGLSLAAVSGGGSSRSDDVFHRHDPRHTYYENDDSGGAGGDQTRTNSFYDRHS